MSKKEIETNKTTIYTTSRKLKRTLKPIALTAVGLFLIQIILNQIENLLQTWTHSKANPGEISRAIENSFDGGADPNKFNWIFHKEEWYFHFVSVKEWLTQFHILNLIIGVLIGTAVGYATSLIIRHHLGEQRPYLDDRAADSMKNQIIKELGFSRQDEAEREGQSGLLFSITNFFKEEKKDKVSEEVIRCIRKVRVDIYTELMPGANTVTTNYFVSIPQPGYSSARRKIQEILHNFNLDLSHISKGEAKFGDMQIDDKNGFYKFDATSENKKLTDAHLKRISPETKNEETTNNIEASEYSFPLELFNDNSGQIKERTAKAKLKAEGLKSSLDIWFTSAGIQVAAPKIGIGNSALAFDYKMAFTTNYPINDMSEDLSMSLEIDGISAKLSGSGSLIVLIPLEENERIPIDIKTMIEGVY